jgi:hypothetical protein
MATSIPHSMASVVTALDRNRSPPSAVVVHSALTRATSYFLTPAVQLNTTVNGGVSVRAGSVLIRKR